MNKKNYFLFCFIFFIKWTYSQSDFQFRINSISKSIFDEQDLKCLSEINDLWEKKEVTPKAELKKELNLDLRSTKLISTISASTLKERIQKLNEASQIKIFKYNTIVHAAVENYLRMGNNLGKLIALAEFYFPLFEEIMSKYDIPKELKYLAIVESHLNAKATSEMGAQGLWQFMPQTGKLYSLYNTNTYDDRNDPIKSTEAACIFLKSLYKELGDWNLVLAAYNSGARTVQRALKQSGKEDFWFIKNYLPKETRNYIPKFIAINYIMNHYKDHNIKTDDLSIGFYQTATVETKENTLLNFLAQELNMSLEELKFLNPQFVSHLVPKERNEIRLPIEKIFLFENKETRIYAYSKKFIPFFPIKPIASKKPIKRSKKRSGSAPTSSLAKKRAAKTIPAKKKISSKITCLQKREIKTRLVNNKTI